MSATDSTLPVNHGELWDRDGVARQLCGLGDVRVVEDATEVVTSDRRSP